MSLKRPPDFDDVLRQAAGITGVGWTASLLGYLGAVSGVGNHLVARIVLVDPQSLLYLGSVLFVATFGLDRLRKTRSDTEE